MAGFAVVDLETTGFAYDYSDRICEIAVVLVDPDGRPEDSYTTLVNPQRNLGAQHIHGIDARDARLAPTFGQIVGDLTGLLAGRVLVAHNSAFDTAFLTAEYARAGWPLELTRDMTLCTMRMAKEYGAPAKLAACCDHFGIPLDDAHAALADATATASLLAAYMAQSGRRDVWDQWLAFGESIPWPAPPRLATPAVPRGASSAGSSLLEDVTRRREVEARLADAESRVTTASAQVELRPGDLVVLTGMSMERKRELTAIAESRGLVVWPGVKKAVRAVVAQDPASQSGKASKARAYGIPVVGEAALTR